MFLVHAVTDVPIELVQTIKTDLEELGVPVRLAMFEEGGHGVGNLIPTRVIHGFPPAQWPKLFLQWYQSLDHRAKPHILRWRALQSLQDGRVPATQILHADSFNP